MNFKVNKQADINGTSLKGYYRASCKDLTTAFGPPEEWDDYKVSTHWTFEDEFGRVFTLYDYKMTSLYDPGYPDPEQFRNQEVYDWHVGGKVDPTDFVEFLNKILKR